MMTVSITYKQARKLIGIKELRLQLRLARNLFNGDYHGDLALLPGGAKLAVEMRPGKRNHYRVKGYAYDNRDIKCLNLGLDFERVERTVAV